MTAQDIAGDRVTFNKTCVFVQGQSGGGGGGNGKKKNLRCHYCKKKGHFARECRKKAADEKRGVVDQAS